MKLERRDFLKLAGVGIGVAVGARAARPLFNLDPTLRIEIDRDSKSLSFEETRDLALRLDQVQDLLPEPQSIPMTEENMWLLADEVLPLFVTEGAVDKVHKPKTIEPRKYEDEKHVQVLGQSNCDTIAVANFRYANPFSPMYGNLDWLGTEVHELVHVQQFEAANNGLACSLDTRENTENTAQIVSWEVMAAMVNGGNEIMIYPLLIDLKGRALGANYALAMAEDRVPEYEELANKINPTELALARREKSRRQWLGREQDRADILVRYGLDPLSRVSYAITNNNNQISDLALPMQYNYPYSFEPTPRTFVIDDLAYFLKNAEAIVKEVAHGKS